MRKLVLAAVLVLMAGGAQSVLAGPLFTGLGALPDGDFHSEAHGISADGSVVVGYSGAGTEEAFRWTPAAGMVGLGRLPGHVSSKAWAASGDGSVVVGDGSGSTGSGTFRWTQSEGIVGLGSNWSGLGASEDGSVVVGYGAPSDPSLPAGRDAFRWTEAGGLVSLGHLPGGFHDSTATGVSADGSVVVGTSFVPDPDPVSFAQPEAFRWTESTGLVGLGELPGGSNDSVAAAVSSDGSTVVGGSISALTVNSREAFRWTEAEGMVGLGELAGGDFYSYASDVSSDGSVLVGQSHSTSGYESFIWDST